MKDPNAQSILLPDSPAWLSFERCPENYHAFLMAELFSTQKRSQVFVAKDDAMMNETCDLLRFIHPQLPILRFPAWDCLPYERVSPKIDLMAERMATLAKCLSNKDPAIVLTTVSALMQKVPPRSVFDGQVAPFKVGDRINVNHLTTTLAQKGFMRVDTVREPGEFAVRGGLIDIYPASDPDPIRVDLFGDEIDSLTSFDTLTQRRKGTVDSFALTISSEFLVTDKNRQTFLENYAHEFGHGSKKDAAYIAVAEQRSTSGLEHLSPLLYPQMESLLDYVDNPLIVLPYLHKDAFEARQALIDDYFEARQAKPVWKEEAPYRSLPTDRLYIPLPTIEARLKNQTVLQLTPFKESDDGHYDAGARPIVAPFKDTKANVYDEFRSALKTWDKPHCVIACYSDGSKTRIEALLKKHGLSKVHAVDYWRDVKKLPSGSVALVTLALSSGFVANDFVVLSEQDLLGDRLTRPHRKKKRADLVLHEASSLNPGDYIVHLEHGIGQFDDLVTIDAGGARHDCLALVYQGGDKLFIPVENIDVCSRFGSKDGLVVLDKLGGSGWQARKAKAKERIREIAAKLMRTAAERQLRHADVYPIKSTSFDEFCARFPYVETDDQLCAIEDTLNDFTLGRPMDRLVCGDVGFGKTEVALRASFIVASQGKQVAVVTPTTLLCRQHYLNFAQRFEGTGISVVQLSRFVTGKQKEKIKQDIQSGKAQIIIGTHALLAKSMEFDDMGLVVVDEEQHFGVTQKEKLKQLKSNTHVLTLTATPIPRTLQMALSGVRNLSLITTPPVDRLSVRTFVSSVDSVLLREAIMREHFRGGQVFYVCPRISDLNEVYEKLVKLVPEIKIATAHGQMSTSELEKIMIDFYQGSYDLLLSTNIIESGIDIPTANTIIVHRADRFGLSQLYQLRGRVGRGKQRAYAYLTLPNKDISSTARKRLEVMQTLDSLGAGFQLASYDMDIRGAGNLLGDEQSGHIREVGVELYQSMLDEAITALKAESGQAVEDTSESWSPTINFGASVLIPEDYVNSLSVRMSLYRRIGSISSKQDIEEFAAELIDRFGPLPEETQNLLDVIELKHYCRQANVEKLEAGEKGLVLTLRNNTFDRPDLLVPFIQSNFGKIRADQSIFFARPWRKLQARKDGVLKLMMQIADLVNPS